MAVGDHGSLSPAIRVDVKAAGAAIEALPVDREPSVESIGFHFFSGLWGTKHAFAGSAPWITT
jgi:hypothetical protein